MSGQVVKVSTSDMITNVTLTLGSDTVDTQFKISQFMEEDEIAPLFDGSVWVGSVVWDAAVLLSRLSVDIFKPDNLRGISVLEVGCGLGIPGMVASILGADLSILTDTASLENSLWRNLSSIFSFSKLHRPPSYIEERKNEYIAPIASTGCLEHTHGKVMAATIDWNDPNLAGTVDKISSSGVDLILSADCICEPLYGQSWKGLASCIAKILLASQNSQTEDLERLATSDLIVMESYSRANFYDLGKADMQATGETMTDYEDQKIIPLADSSLPPITKVRLVSEESEIQKLRDGSDVISKDMKLALVAVKRRPREGMEKFVHECKRLGLSVHTCGTRGQVEMLIVRAVNISIRSAYESLYVI